MKFSVNVSGANLLPPSARKPALFKKAALLALKREKVKARGELNLVFVDRKRMLAINKQFLGHNYDTDVVAFDYYDDEVFGDVFISAYMARKQAAELKHGLLEEALTLVLHGTLHLCGHDDHAPAKKKKMFARQAELLALLL